MPQGSDAPLAPVDSPLRVFVVEDSQRVCALLTEQLNDIPNVVVVGAAASEQAAVDALSHLACDVLIVDINLRAGNGIGVLRKLSAMAGSISEPGTRIVFSNYTEREYRLLAERYGAKYFFDKSTDLIALLTLVLQLASGH